MRNPFAKPETVSQWLLGSVCWTVCCVGWWLASSYLLSCFGNNLLTTSWGNSLFLTGFLAVQILIWRKGVVRGWRIIDPTQSFLFLTITACVWLVLLVLSQLASLLIVGALLIWTH